jgi:hypothetical protein
MTPVMQTPFWLERVISVNHRQKTAGTFLPKIPALPYSQYPVSWFEHRGIEEEIGISELVKFMDDNTNGKTPWTKTLAIPPSPSSKGLRVLQHSRHGTFDFLVNLSHWQVWH